MFHHLTTKMKGKGKHKKSEGSSSSSQAQSDMSASLFAVIVSFPLVFIYTRSYQFIVMFYVACLMFLLVCVTPHVTDGLIMFIKWKLSPNARLNQDTKVWNQIQRQRFKISSSV
jgi:hypothetical protein